MTDRLKGCTVTFEHDIREDDARPLISAICRLRGVADVTHLLVRPSGTHRLQTADGSKWIVPSGWLAIELDVAEWSL